MRPSHVLTAAAVLLLAGACAPAVTPATTSPKPTAQPAVAASGATPSASASKPPPADAEEAPVVALPPDRTTPVPATDLADEPLVPPVSAGGRPPDAASSGGEGIGLGAVGTIGHGSGVGYGSGHGRLGSSAPRAKPPRVRMGATSVSGTSRPSPRPAPLAKPSPSAQVKAGEWDDNANYREFLQFLATSQSLAHTKLDVSHRRFIVVRDTNGRPVPSCPVAVKDNKGHTVKLLTTGSGRAVLFPRAESFAGDQLEATAECQGQKVTIPFSTTLADGVVDLKLAKARVMPDKRTVDIAFVLDTTGSMSEEIGALKSTIAEVSKTLTGMNVRIRVGLVEYRDRQDVFLTRLHQMTTDIPGFSQRIDALQAQGGGDTPEDVNEGLRVAVADLDWKESSVARLAFLIGDAPPQLAYANAQSYMASAKQAQHKGVQLFTVAASGMDQLGQVVWRQVAQYTGGTNMFVLRGGAGPQSVGGGDPLSSCGGTHQNYRSGNLAELITKKIEIELAAVDGDPMLIAGLHKDEKAKPCKQRVQQLATR